MSKAPAFQFYPADWLTDVELQSASATSRGIWINALCLMWESKTRGQLTGRTSSLARILNCTIDEFEAFVGEVKNLKFAEASVTCNADVRFCNSEVTLTNRRMFNEEKVRQQTRLRVQKHRSNTSCNGEVTHASSSSSSCTKVHLEKESPLTPQGENGDKKQDSIPPQKRGITKRVHICPDYVPAPWKQIFQEWLNYKREKGQAYTETGARACFKKLRELSGDRPEVGTRVVEQSIANNYAGIFPLKNIPPGKTTSDGKMSEAARRTMENLKRGRDEKRGQGSL